MGRRDLVGRIVKLAAVQGVQEASGGAAPETSLNVTEEYGALIAVRGTAKHVCGLPRTAPRTRQGWILLQVRSQVPARVREVRPAVRSGPQHCRCEEAEVPYMPEAEEWAEVRLGYIVCWLTRPRQASLTPPQGRQTTPSQRGAIAACGGANYSGAQQ